MLKLYLDIDGVLLTTKHTRAAPGIEAFIDFVTSHFECYWLTTHCKGDSAPALRYLSRFLQRDTIDKLKHTVLPTNWDTLKTEAIDTRSDFYWLDDQPFQSEMIYLQANGVADRLITVSLDRPNELTAIQASLRQLIE
jgi:hypothetical protein